MGVPDGDKLGTLCREEMNKVETSVAAIRAAIKNVNNLIGCDTWVGTAATNWGTDFQGRTGRLGRLFDSYPAEETRLVAEAEKKQAKLSSPGPAG